MARIHLILQGKGGVGKSMIAAVLAQYVRSKGGFPLCVDTDPINKTFGGYEKLQVQPLEIMEGDEINPRRFDELIELIAATEAEDVIVDNGASSFVPLSYYLVSNQVPSLLAEMGHEIVAHTVVTGGQALLDTLNGFGELARQLPGECHFIVWLNPFWGAVELDGKPFEQMQVYKTNKGRISAVVRVPRLKQELHGRDFAEMLQARLTFDEAIAAECLQIMARQRLKLVQREIFSALEASALLDGALAA